MKYALKGAAALLLTTTAAHAGGLDRTGNAYSALFEDGNYVELSFSKTMPEVSGEYPGGPLGTGSTGNMAEAYSSASFAIKQDLGSAVSLGFFFNQPFGANAAYTAGAYTGLTADWASRGMSVVLKYQINPNLSVYGGARSVSSEADLAIPDALIRGQTLQTLQAGIAAATAGGDVATATALGAQATAVATAPDGSFNYVGVTESDRQTSYIAGIAYERPEIALRVALTYESGFTHSFATTETLLGGGIAGLESIMEIEMPQSVTLDFQSGVAADTLVFGSVKWTEWSVWEVSPVGYATYTGGGDPANGDAVTGLDNDVMTYRLGVGRRLNDQFAVFGRVTYEAANGGEASRLAPTDGQLSIGLGGTYTMDNVEITGGVEYAWLGDAEVGDGTLFEGNTALGAGVSIGVSF